MFDDLTEKLSLTFKKLRGHGRLNEKIIAEALKEVKMSLLEADVNFKVVKGFTDRIAQRASGQEVMRSLTPAQQVVKIVRDELVQVMGEEAEPLNRADKPPTVIMMVGLQGSGKTTTVGKLTRLLKGEGKNVVLSAADIHRPAAAEQLQTIGGEVEAEVVIPGKSESLKKLARRSLDRARGVGADYLIFDTAGRLHVDREMMKEAGELSRLTSPDEILLVADAMTGQDAVNVAQGFSGVLDLTGIILTKFDGDARGGAALSMRAVTGLPIKFIGLGEKMDALEVFYPDRLASRILGMGDVLTLIEKVEKAVDEDETRKLEEKIRKNQFTLDDFRNNLKMVKNMGSMEDIASMIPGLGKLTDKQGLQMDEGQIKRAEAIINSMTPAERTNHKIINMSRRRRIAAGSGTDIQDVNRLIKQFDQTRKMMKKFSKMDSLTKAAKMGRGLFPN